MRTGRRFMIMKKFAGLLTAAVLTALTLTGCAGSEAAGSADATAEHPLVLNLSLIHISEPTRH